jgi:hypothetical protein
MSRSESHKISNYSYLSKSAVWLEEDSDMNKFIQVFGFNTGYELKIKNVNREVRAFESDKVPFTESLFKVLPIRKGDTITIRLTNGIVTGRVAHHSRSELVIVNGFGSRFRIKITNNLLSAIVTH